MKPTLIEVDPAALTGPGVARTILAGAVVLVAGGWTAFLLGLPPVATGVAASLCFALMVATLLHWIEGQRRAGAAVRRRMAELRVGDGRSRTPTEPTSISAALLDCPDEGARTGRAALIEVGTPTDPSGEAVVSADGSAVPRHVSSSGTALLGAVPEDLVGTALADRVHPDDPPAHRGGLDALRASEAVLRGLIDASPDCIEVLDLEGRVTFVSRNGLCLLDLDAPEAVLGRDFASLWPDGVRGAIRSSIAAATAGAVSRFTAHCVSAKGRPLSLDVAISPISGADGEPDRLLVLSRDVTAGTEAEAGFRKFRDRYRLLAEHSSDVVMLRTVGPTGHALYVSPSCGPVLGAPPDVVLSTYPANLVHPDDLPAVQALLATLKASDGVVLQTHRVQRADGALIWVEGAFQAAERDGDTAIVVALRDVTERQQRAEDLAAAKEAAEQAQRAAEQASEAKSDFIASVSHEIRTPLNSIIGFTDLMLDMQDLPEEVQRHAELIRTSGLALLTVVSDVLDFSKVEAGAVEIEAIPFSPVALAESCISIVRGYAGTKAIAIALEADAAMPQILVGDEARLRQVLLNLLNNAVKFTARGGVTLRLLRSGATATTETIRFEVADTGIGIPRSEQHRLFERFSQVDSSVARRFGGSGLGLAICKKLVELMGGSIGVLSEAGTGSTFWFTVTLARATVSEPVAAAEPGAAARTGRILLAEDVELNQRLAVALLEAGGHVVDVVDDGALAVAAAARTAYDLVLMDVQMPGMDGVSATRAIRAAVGPHREVPIVALTANVFPDQIRAFREAGMNDHIGKPLSRTQLQRAVARWIRPGSGAAAAEAPPEAADARPSFDGAAYLDLVAHLGPERLDDVLSRFAMSLTQRFVGGEARAGTMHRWRADAHVVQSVAGMLGLSELSELCRALEAAAPGSDAQADRLAAVRRARDAAIERIAGLRADLAGSRGGDTAVA